VPLDRWSIGHHRSDRAGLGESRDWAASDRGRRLDHIWVTPPLVGALSAARVHRDSRAWEKASDHVPVMIDIG